MSLYNILNLVVLVLVSGGLAWFCYATLRRIDECMAMELSCIRNWETIALLLDVSACDMSTKKVYDYLMVSSSRQLEFALRNTFWFMFKSRRLLKEITRDSSLMILVRQSNPAIDEDLIARYR